MLACSAKSLWPAQDLKSTRYNLSFATHKSTPGHGVNDSASDPRPWVDTLHRMEYKKDQNVKSSYVLDPSQSLRFPHDVA